MRHSAYSAHASPPIIPTISVFGTEVTLPIYFQAIDLHTAGHKIDSILVHIVATTHISNLDVLRETVQNIILNVQLMNNPSQTLTLPGEGGHEETTSRQNSRIEFVDELDDLSAVRLVVEDQRRKEKERGVLRSFIKRLG